MSKLFIKEFRQPIYPVSLWVAITNDALALSKYFNKEDERGIGWGCYASCSCVTKVRESEKEWGVVIQFESAEAAAIKIISHEAVHAAQKIFERLGAEMTPDEPFAYLVGYISECCEEAVRAFKKQES